MNVSSADASSHYVVTHFDNSLMYWVRMDDVDGSGLYTDLSPFANNATPTGSIVQTPGAIWNASIALDGGSYLTSPDSPQLDTVQNMTLSAWVYVTSNLGVVQPIISKSPSYLDANNPYWLGTTETGQGLRFSRGDASANFINVDSNVTIPLTQRLASFARGIIDVLKFIASLFTPFAAVGDSRASNPGGSDPAGFAGLYSLNVTAKPVWVYGAPYDITIETLDADGLLVNGSNISVAPLGLNTTQFQRNALAQIVPGRYNQTFVIRQNNVTRQQFDVTAAEGTKSITQTLTIKMEQPGFGEILIPTVKHAQSAIWSASKSSSCNTICGFCSSSWRLRSS